MNISSSALGCTDCKVWAVSSGAHFVQVTMAAEKERLEQQRTSGEASERSR